MEDNWERVNRRKRIPRVNISDVKECSISAPIKCRRMTKSNLDVFNNVMPVSITDNNILDGIMENITTVSPSLIGKTFYAMPDNRYWFRVIDATRKKIDLEQWCCHYDSIMQLTPIAVRKVVIQF